MKNIYLIALILTVFTTNLAFGQIICSPEEGNTISFYSQSDVDFYNNYYSDCTEFEGNIEISGSDINDLSAFGNLEKIYGNLYIHHNSNLKNIYGFGSLEYVAGDIIIHANYKLTDIIFFSLSQIGGDLQILSNTELIEPNISDYLHIDGDLVFDQNLKLEKLGVFLDSDIGGSIRIHSNYKLKNLEGLDFVQNIGGDIEIYNDKDLINFQGLEKLKKIEGKLFVKNNNKLQNFEGLNNLTYVNTLSVLENSNLQNFAGLNKLNKTGEYIFITKNNSLQNLNGLENLTEIGDNIEVSNCSSIDDISGIRNIDPNSIESHYSEYKDLEIYNNPNLSVCHIESVCDYLEYKGANASTHIENNDTGCNSEQEIFDNCGLGKPDCTSLKEPTNGSQNVSRNITLKWNASDYANGYKLKVGTVSGGTDILNNKNVGNTTEYNLQNLPCGKNIYVTIIPYKDDYEATGCGEQSFKTKSTVEISISGDNSLCLNDTIILTGTPNGGEWSSDNANIVFLDNLGTITGKAPCTGTVTYTFTSDGCTNSKTKNITVNPNPLAQFQVYDNSSNSPVGETLSPNTDYKFIDKSKSNANDANLKNRTWEFTGMLNETQTKAEFVKSFSTTGGFNLSLKVENDFNCSDVVDKDFTISNETAFNLIGSEEPYCTQSDITFELQVSNPGSESISYKWFVNNIAQNESTKTFVFHPPNKGNYTIKCEVSISGNSNVVVREKEIEVLELPVNDYLINDIRICKDGNTINLSSLYQGTIHQFDNIIFEANGSSVDFFNPSLYSGTTKIKYYLTNGGCNSEENSFSITVTQAPEDIDIVIVDEQNKYCGGDTISVLSGTFWEWTPTPYFQDDNMVQFILSSENSTIKAKENVFGCISEAQKTLDITPAPKLPDLQGNIFISSGDTFKIEIENQQNVEIEVIPPPEKTENGTVYYFAPESRTAYKIIATNSESMCSTSREFVINISSGEIIPVDQCSKTVMGAIFLLDLKELEDIIDQNNLNIEWKITPNVNFKGNNTKAIVVEWEENTSKAEICVEYNDGNLSSNICMDIDSVSNFLTLNTDTILHYEPCGDIVYLSDDVCGSNIYNMGWVDHKSGDYYTYQAGRKYFIDENRDSLSDRTYFMNCHDCNSSANVYYRNENNEECLQKDYLEVMVAPNPNIGEFTVYIEGRYRGKFDIQMYNPMGKLINNWKINKDNFRNIKKIITDTKGGVYYIRVNNNKGYIKTVPIVILN